MLTQATATLEEVLEDRVRIEGSCKVWLGYANKGGYGIVAVGGKHKGAHRASYEHFVGEIPIGHELHHICHNRACIEPSHLLPLTRLAHAKLRRPREITGCPHGHPYNEANTYVTKTGNRLCRRCNMIRRRKNLNACAKIREKVTL